MSINQLTIDKLEIPTEESCRRVRIDTGPFCNYDCTFCYYKGNLHKRKKWEDIKSQIDTAIEYGALSLDFSGGESSVEPLWFDILGYANDKVNYLSCLSHGGKFSDLNFLQKSKDNGLKEILFSLHGYTEEVHDSITNRRGSFKKIIQAIHNANKLGVKVRINCTISVDNYSKINTNILKELNPYQVNFIIVNYFDANKVSENNKISYETIAPYIHSYIDELSSFIKYINVRYIPFCFMVGYEKYVIDYMQLPFDLYDWSLAFYNNNLSTIRSGSNTENLWSSAAAHRVFTYNKPLECLKCKYAYICDGMEKTLEEKVHPIEGDKIVDPLYYCRNNLIKEPPK